MLLYSERNVSYRTAKTEILSVYCAKATTDLIDYVNKKVLLSNEVGSCVSLYEPNNPNRNQILGPPSPNTSIFLRPLQDAY